jgi:branched-subunit amino acid ABC-type transport system permease component
MLNELVNGIAFGSLLFVLASGFTLSLGLIKVINIAHGAFYMLGAYVAISATRQTGSFLWGVVVSSVAIGVLAVVLQLGLLRRLQFQPLRQVLCTFGVTLIVAELCRHTWGSYPELLETPGFLKGTVELGSVMLPGYRLFVVVVAIVLALSLWLMLSRTRVGAVVRACIDDQEIARTVGIDVDRVFVLMFGFAGMLAGLGGAIGAPFLGAYQGVEFEILALTLVVVVIGGLGSILGAFIGSMLIGIVNSIGTAAFPELSYFLLFGPMILILVLRPQGLLGQREGR